MQDLASSDEYCRQLETLVLSISTAPGAAELGTRTENPTLRHLDGESFQTHKNAGVLQLLLGSSLHSTWLLERSESQVGSILVDEPRDSS